MRCHELGAVAFSEIFRLLWQQLACPFISFSAASAGPHPFFHQQKEAMQATRDSPFVYFIFGVVFVSKRTIRNVFSFQLAGGGKWKSVVTQSLSHNKKKVTPISLA
jgi:hypothetical protein